MECTYEIDFQDYLLLITEPKELTLKEMWVWALVLLTSPFNQGT
jgi:hypothetical protein